MESSTSLPTPRRTYNPKWWIGELLSSFIFGLAITGAFFSAYQEDAFTTSVRIGLAAGLACVVNIVCFSDISGAHFNPVITLTAALMGKLKATRAVEYCFVQLTGFIAAASITSYFSEVKFSFKKNVQMLLPAPSSPFIAFIVEFGLVFLFVLVNCILSYDASEGRFIDLEIENNAISSSSEILSGPGTIYSSIGTRNAKVVANPKVLYAPATMGMLVCLLIVIGRYLSGAFFNPALFLAPCILGGSFDLVLWYVGGQVFGAIAAVFVFVQMFTALETVEL
jgi:glycerol uptake facilitator-like aquaporin